MRLTPCIPSLARPWLRRRLLTLGFVGMFGLLLPQAAPSSAVATEQAAIPLPQALDQLDTALSSLESSVQAGQSTPAKTPPESAAPVATPQQMVGLAKQLHERRLFAAAASLLSETLVRSRELSQDADVLWLLGDSLSELGDLRGAKRYLGQFVDSHPTDGKALTKLLALSSTLPADPMEKT